MAKRDTPFGWTCPFCGRAATIQDADYSHWYGDHWVSDAVDGNRFVETHVIVCPNPECKRATLWVSTASISHWDGRPAEVLQEWHLIPPSDAKVFPDYVPAAIRDTYTEACLIRDLSPQASATLARRALQGMLRDFFDATEKARLLHPKKKNPTLADEINAVKDEIDPLTWDAIDAVRTVGNIGAHMEEDVNLIVEVDPNEAQLLISLVEQLMGDWYVNRHERKAGLERLVGMAKVKEQERRRPGSESAEAPEAM